LAPEISEHWFRKRIAEHLPPLLKEERMRVHWYASVRPRQVVSLIDGAYIRSHAGDQPFSALVRPLL
jgi:hypothetical protein